MSIHKWSDVEKGIEGEDFQKTLRVLDWLSKGYEIELGGRTISIQEGENKQIIILNRTTVWHGNVQQPDGVLGLGDSLSWVHREVNKLSKEEFTILAANVALNDIRRNG